MTGQTKCLIYTIGIVLIGVAIFMVFGKGCNPDRRNVQTIYYEDSLRIIQYKIEIDELMRERKWLNAVVRNYDSILGVTNDKLIANEIMYQKQLLALQTLSKDELVQLLLTYLTNDTGVIAFNITYGQVVQALEYLHELEYSRKVIKIQQLQIRTLTARGVTKDAIIENLQAHVVKAELNTEEVQKKLSSVRMELEQGYQDIAKITKGRNNWRGISAGFLGALLIVIATIN